MTYLAQPHSQRRLDDRSPSADYRQKRFITLAGAAANLPLAVGKIAVGYVGQSQALIADGLHSLSDLVSDAVVLYAVKKGSKGADLDHPYGHARIETAATVLVGLLLMLVAAGLILDAVRRLFEPELLLVPGWLALGVAFVSLVVKEALYWYTLRMARRLKSNLLRANAWHHRSDAISSLVALIGIGGSMAGLPYLDSLAAAAIAVMLGKIGWDCAWQSVRELVDTGLAPDRLAVLRRTVASVPGVHRLHALRTRMMGQDAFADAEILVHPYLSVSEGHRISEEVRARLIAEVEEVVDVCVHIEPKEQTDPPPSHDLPLRETVLADLGRHWQGVRGSGDILRVTLHYLDDAIDVELLLPLDVAADLEDAERVRAGFAALADAIDYVRSIEVSFRPHRRETSRPQA